MVEEIFKSMSLQVLGDTFIWATPEEREEVWYWGDRNVTPSMGNVWRCWNTWKLATGKKNFNFCGGFFSSFFQFGVIFLDNFLHFFCWGFSADPEAHVISESKMSYLLQRIFWKSHLRNFDLPLGPFHCKTFKKSLQQMQRNRRNTDTSILDSKWTICPKYEYLWKIY